MVQKCRYEDGRVIFTTTHFSFYIIGYNPVSFTDITEHPMKRLFEKAAARSLVVGYADGSLRPNKTVTRAEFVQMIINILDLPAPQADTLD